MSEARTLDTAAGSKVVKSDRRPILREAPE
jgi:hypothetical protein